MQIFDTWQGTLVVVLIAAAIMGGALTAFVRLTDRNTPVDTGLLHGRVGALAVLLLVVFSVLGEGLSASVKPAVVLFVLTVLAGAALYYIIRRKGVLPKRVILIHGVLAIAGLTILLFGLPV